MPLLLVLTLAVACLPLPWPPPPAGLTAAQSAAAAWLLAVLPAGLSGFTGGWAATRVTREPDRRPALRRTLGRVRRVTGWLGGAAAAAGVGLLGWGHTATAWATGCWLGADAPTLFPGAELLVPAPYLVGVGLGWVGRYPADRALTEGEFWPFPAYLLFHARHFVLAAGLPVGLFVAQQSVARAAPAATASDAGQLVGLAAGFGLFVGLPLVVKPLLGWRPLPPGPARNRLDATRRRLGVRVGRVFEWPTRGAVANAVVLGLVPRLRYVAFTDRLLAELPPAELDAVYGHEAGHARHGHLPYYVAFLTLSSVAGTALAGAADAAWPAALTVPAAWVPWRTAVPLVGLGVYLFLVFGWLSRRCERQADVFGARAGSCHNPDCSGHDESTVLLAGRELTDRGVCRTGALTLASALDRVAALNGFGRPTPAGRRAAIGSWVRAWQHGPMAARTDFLRAVAADPILAARADRRAFRARVALATGLIAVTLAGGLVAGWFRPPAADSRPADDGVEHAQHLADGVDRVLTPVDGQVGPGQPEEFPRAAGGDRPEHRPAGRPLALVHQPGGDHCRNARPESAEQVVVLGLDHRHQRGGHPQLPAGRGQ